MKLRLLISAPLLAVTVFGSACGEGNIGGLDDRGSPRDAFDAGASGVDAGDATDPPPPAPPGGGGLDPAGRGPTGQWPDGFPAYSTAADIVTDGSSGSLTAALNNATCSTGCVIEHAGNFSHTGKLTRVGTGEIVVRPPIGQRANFSLSGVFIGSSNLVFAGYAHSGSSLAVAEGVNSGFAWMESDAGGLIWSLGENGDITEAFFYEIVYRQFAPTGQGDRGGIRASYSGRSDMLVVGSIITGTTDAPPAHADTFQVYWNGASGSVTVRDSIIWPSWDKANQGMSSTNVFHYDNVYLSSPSHANTLWPGPGTLNFSQPYHTTGVSDFHNSTIIGGNHPSFFINIWDSELYDAGSAWNDMGGNTVLDERPAPPLVPTHEELDAIWSP